MPLTTVPGSMINGSGFASMSGVTFPATQVTSTDANTLDDYEEGTWTPTFTGGSGNPTYTLGATVAKYVKVGRMVTFSMSFQWSNRSGGSGTLFISLPFATYNDGQGFQGNYPVGYAAGIAKLPKGGYNDPGNASFFLVDASSGTANLNISDLSASGHLICGGTYQTS